jgi:hypothetical protein
MAMSIFLPFVHLDGLGVQERMGLEEMSRSKPSELKAPLDRMWLAREPGARSGERGKRERGAGIVVKNPEIDKFHQK